MKGVHGKKFEKLEKHEIITKNPNSIYRIYHKQTNKHTHTHTHTHTYGLTLAAQRRIYYVS